MLVTKRTRRWFALVLLGGLALSGCYTYRPTSLEELHEGEKIRARLTGAEARAIEQYIPRDARTVDATLIENGGDSLLLGIPVITDARGYRVETLSQRIRVSRAGIVDLETRELDRNRTLLVIGASMVAIGGLIAAAGGGSADDNPQPPGPPPDEDFMFKIPLWRFR